MQNENRGNGLNFKHRHRYSSVLMKNSRLNLQLNIVVSVIHQTKAACDIEKSCYFNNEKKEPEKMSRFALLHLQAPSLCNPVGVCNFRGQTGIAWPIKTQEGKKKTQKTV